MRKNIPQKLRLAVVKKCGIKCHYCGRKTVPANRHLDHVIPVEAGGINSIDNLVVSCKKCNTEKGKIEYWTYVNKRVETTRLHLETLLRLLDK
jgi:5-methylcytosine-specific restriction endonuclease McrA